MFVILNPTKDDPTIFKIVDKYSGVLTIVMNEEKDLYGIVVSDIETRAGQQGTNGAALVLLTKEDRIALAAKLIGDI